MLLGVLPAILGVVAMTGIVHIVSLFAMPRLAPKDAFSRVSTIAPLFKIWPVPSASRDQLPFEDPATELAICRYDLRQGPLHMTGTLQPDSLMLFTFSARYGQIFYSMTDRGASRGRLDVLVLTQAQLDSIETAESGDELPAELRIVAPTNEGFVLVRTLAEQQGDVPEARRRVTSIGCALGKTPNS